MTRNDLYAPQVAPQWETILNFAAAFAFQSKVGLIQESISNGVVLVMASQSVQQRSAHDAMVNPSPALLAEKGKKFTSRMKQGGYSNE